MRMLAYGEDSLTLWTLATKLNVILDRLDDGSQPGSCQMLYRPSFGRRGGDWSSQFGEFDFMILARKCLYLGETKWQRSSEKVRQGVLQLRANQRDRHKVFEFYVRRWTSRRYQSWRDFVETEHAVALDDGRQKPLAPVGSLLARNLETILRQVREHYDSVPDIRSVLLYLYDGNAIATPSVGALDGFELVVLDYSADSLGGFVWLDI